MVSFKNPLCSLKIKGIILVTILSKPRKTINTQGNPNLARRYLVKIVPQ
jgi:hypothetical protein